MREEFLENYSWYLKMLKISTADFLEYLKTPLSNLYKTFTQYTGPLDSDGNPIDPYSNFDQLTLPM